MSLRSAEQQRIATHLGQSGSYPAARDLWQLIADAYSENDAMVLSTQAPSPPVPASPGGPVMRGTQPPPGTSTPRCCPWMSASSA